MRQLVVVLCTVFALVMTAEATTWQVTVQDFQFSPAMLTVAQGDTVIWTAVQGFHNVHHACGTTLFGNAIQSAPWTYEFVFDIAPGDYPYECEVHPTVMMGMISVQRIPQRWNVTVQNYSFTPANLAVQQGDTVVWTNVLGTHDVHHTGTPSLFGNTIGSAPWVYPFVFNLPAGSYPYVCEVHPSLMQGTVTVSAPPPPPAAPSDLVVYYSNGSVTLNWSPVAGASCYVIYVSSTATGVPFTQMAGITAATSFNQPIPAQSLYFFEVRAVGN